MTAAAALALCLAIGAGTACSPATASDAPPTAQSATARTGVRFELPEPTGRQPVGSTELHLVDHDRRDPWVTDRERELMVSVWYPATTTRGCPRRPYMPPGVARALDQSGSFELARPGEVDWAGIRTDAARTAPVEGRRGRPVVLYSPGLQISRTLGTSTAMELASRGYVVVTLDHTYEAPAVEFPGGRIERQVPMSGDEALKKMLDTRVRDTRFVLDQLAVLRAGGNPDAEGRRLPEGLGRALDLRRVGMYGHSGGGATAAETMRVDRLIDAGINMDGTLKYNDGEYLPVAEEGLDRPFMLMGKASQTHLNNPSWQSFWDHSTGWKRDLSLERGSHFSYTDAQSFVPALDKHLDIPAELRERYVGTVDSERSTAAQRAYLTAFFDQHLRGRPQRLLTGPSPSFPEINFVR
ncbi:alpha/beta hydrolase family protein [Streptomyces luteolus]|uniref:Lipase n=1 Tax=Streptomyces luteolus TaxID=3043615 RepID=A0ABT6T1C1_9ACTN|nr:lipase [Streptomyces sp. B-S-A12]MDI3421650.1 lipase [Streptomyces sp. B-S-A12]